MEKAKEKFKERLNEEYNKFEEAIDKPNILLVGGTGVGKSSLVNLVFGEEVAKVGTGEPVTDGLNKYQSPESSVVLYDTAGYEIGSEKQKRFLNEVVNFATNNKKSLDEKPHLVWYCIDASGHRVEDIDKKVIKNLYQSNVPTAVVFTKCDLVTKDEIETMEQEINNNLPNIPMFNLTAIDDSQFDIELDYLDLDKLISWSINSLPSALKVGFIKAQKRNLEEKREKAKKMIFQHTGGSGLVGFSPIPFSDAPILLSNQAGMFARILNVYDMKYMLKDFKNVAGGLGLGQIISSSGIYIVGQLSKLIPGAGSIVGGIISGSVASGITAALGFAISELCYRISEAAIEGRESDVSEIINNLKPIMSELFEKYYKKEIERENN